MIDLLLRDVRLPNHAEVVDIAIAGEKFYRIGQCLDVDARRTIQVGGRLVLPPLVDCHLHLDSCLSSNRIRPNVSGTLAEGIAIWRDLKPSLTVEDILARARQLVKWAISQGTLFLRTHADVTVTGEASVRALIALREEFASVVKIQVCAFPQDGLLTTAESASHVERAIRLGVDCIGGIPHNEHTTELGTKSINRIFDLAVRNDLSIDIHCDETDDPQSRFLESIAGRALERGLGSRVTASHCTAMGSYEPAYSARLRRLLARARVNIVCNPLVNATLQGRADAYPKRRGFAQVKELLAANVNVSLGSDAIMDPWYPLGRADLLAAVDMAVHFCHMTGADEIDAMVGLATARGARTMGVEDEYGVAEGKPAGLVVVDAQSVPEVVRLRPARRWVISRGRIVAETEPATTSLSLRAGEREVMTFRPREEN